MLYQIKPVIAGTFGLDEAGVAAGFELLDSRRRARVC